MSLRDLQYLRKDSEDQWPVALMTSGEMPVTTSNRYQIIACTRVQYWADYQQSTVVVLGSSSI